MSAMSKVITCAVKLRVREDVRGLIDRAAKSKGKTRSDFMIDASRRAVEETLLDQTTLRVDAKTHAQFIELLDKAPSGEGYRRLMDAPKPWAS